MPRASGSTEAIKVLHVFSFFRPDFTGEGIYLEKLAVNLSGRGITSDVVVAATQAPRVPQAVEAIGDVRFFGSRRRRAFYLNLKMAAWFARNVGKYDVVHFHAWVDRVLLYHLIAYASARPIVQSCTLDDGLGSHVEGYRSIYRSLVRWLINLIDVNVAISPKLYYDCLEIMPAERVTFIPQGADIPTLDGAARSELRGKWGIGADEIVLLFVGGISARKDLMFLIENHEVLASFNPRLRLIVVGPDLEDDYAAAVRQRAVKSPFGDSVSFAGYMDDPSSAYRIADVFVFASRSEGFGNVLIEAMSFGLPVVCRRLQGVTDHFVVTGVNGFLFDTPTEYIDLVKALVCDSAMRTATGNAARQTIIERFSMDAIAEKYAELYLRSAVSMRERRKMSSWFRR